MREWFRQRLRWMADWMAGWQDQRFSLRMCLETGRCEGWTIDAPQCGLTGASRPELCRLETMPDGGLPPFRCDVDAWRHVVAQARAGSLPHRAALRKLDPAALKLIETHCGSWSDQPVA